MALAVSAWAIASCGLQTDPVPKTLDFPTTEEVKIWQREQEAIVSWWMPSAFVSRLHGGLEGFILIIERLPFDCQVCPPEGVEEVELTPDSGRTVLENSRLYYSFPIAGEPGGWRVRVVTLFQRGETAPSPAAFLDGAVVIPTSAMDWEWVIPRDEGAVETLDAFSIRLFWPPTRERVVRVVTPGGTMEERERFFRVNIYQTKEGGKSSLAPVNPSPLTARSWRHQPIMEQGRSEPLEFSMRLVDQAGNEGASSPSVRIYLPGYGS